MPMAEDRPIDTHVHLDHEPELNKFFKAVTKARASDLHLKVGQVPKMRLGGALKNTTGEPLTEKRTEELVFELLSDAQKDYFLKNGTLEFAHEISDTERFRINVFRQRGMISLVARRIESRIPPFESLHLPGIVKELAEAQEGLILVTGPVGCGKTTTLASMVDIINRTRSCHIITFEDPIEYLYKDRKALVSQREIGIDLTDLDEALYLLARQDPDVVVISELHDHRTISAAIKSAEAGHLVFGTLNAGSVVQSVQRLLDLFPQDERNQARQSFSMAFKAIICQELLPCTRDNIGRIPLVEVLISNPIARKVIADRNEGELPNVIRACKNEGMLDVTESLCQLVNDEYIDVKKAYEYAPNIEELKMALKGIKTTARTIM
jgi:twitching motility protein PilT